MSETTDDAAQQSIDEWEEQWKEGRYFGDPPIREGRAEEQIPWMIHAWEERRTNVLVFIAKEQEFKRRGIGRTVNLTAKQDAEEAFQKITARLCRTAKEYDIDSTELRAVLSDPSRMQAARSVLEELKLVVETDGASGSSKPLRTPLLDESDGVILQKLARANRALKLVELAVHADRSVGVCKARAKTLETAGLLVRKGKRGGVAITEAGRKRLMALEHTLRP